MKLCVIRQEERRQNGVWFGVWRTGLVVVPVVRLTAGEASLAVPHLRLQPNSLIHSYLGRYSKKLKVYRHLRIMQGVGVRVMRLGVVVRVAIYTKAPRSLYYSPLF